MVKILTSKKAKNSSYWVDGYQENEWNEFQGLENASFIENDNEITFTTMAGKKIGYTKNYLDERNDELVTYEAPGSFKITKYLNDPGIFEVISRTGHYFRVSVKSDYSQPAIKIPHYKVTLDQQELLMISQGFAQGFLTMYDSSETYCEKTANGKHNIFFRYITIFSNQLEYYAKNGTLARGDNYYEWLKIKEKFLTPLKIEDISPIELNKLQRYNHQNFL